MSAIDGGYLGLLVKSKLEMLKHSARKPKSIEARVTWNAWKKIEAELGELMTYIKCGVYADPELQAALKFRPGDKFMKMAMYDGIVISVPIDEYFDHVGARS